MSLRTPDRITSNMLSHLEQLKSDIPGLLNTPFQFSQKSDHIRWNELEELDIDQMQKRTDLHKMEKVLSYATYAKLRKEDLDRIGDPAMIKLFKLGQLTMEYMQFTQNTLENMIDGIDVKYR
jgi:glycerophosphoryl diester phosphodiesterase